MGVLNTDIYLVSYIAPKFSGADDLAKLENQRGEIKLSEEEKKNLDALSNEKQRAAAKKTEFDPKKQTELEELANKQAKGGLSDEGFVNHKALKAAAEEESNTYNDLVLNEDTGAPTEQSIFYMLMAMGVLKPKPFEGLSVSDLIKKLIADKRRQLSKADPGSDRHKQLEKWLKDAE